ncbi:methyl-accepting chemotaxis protein [Bacillaceae bacterium IKA-2]|nr:methyl-accepting chemotaxis protein [Bacillaceae bacterium IKA-2]
MLSLRIKILSGFGIILLLLLIVSSYSIFNNTKINSNVEQMIENDLQRLATSDFLAINMAERLALVRGYILIGDKDYKQRYMELTEESAAIEKQLLALTDNETIHDLIEKSQRWDLLIIERIIPMYEENGRDTAVMSIQYQVDPLAEEVIEGYRLLAKSGQDEIISNGREIIKNGHNLVIFNIIATLIAIILSVVVAMVTAGKIVNPILAVVSRVEQIAKGDLTGNTIENHPNDELGRLTASTNDMACNLRNLLTQTTNTSDQVAAASEQLTANSEQTTIATKQIVATIQEVARGADTTVNGTKESARAMEEMTMGIQRIAESSSIVSESSFEATKEAEEGNKSLHRVIEQMKTISDAVKEATTIIGRLGERSSEIGSIVGVITNISKQTNLLALNAAIEAARAGEHGKGFAVVADEVRKLAEGSQKSAAQISLVIQEIQDETTFAVKTMDNGSKEVESGIQVVEETGLAFEKILAAIQNVSTQIQEVSATAEEMSASSEQVSASVDEMAHVAIETSESFQTVASGAEQQLFSMEEIKTSASSLSTLAQELQDEIRKFKL